MRGPGARPAPPPRSRHFLRSRAFADEIVRAAGVEPGALVLDLGAGGGILTRALLDAGARVVAVELDAPTAAALRRRFVDEARVEVVEADAAALALPREPFAVVANFPFAGGTAILRALLDDPRVPLRRLDAIVEWGLAAKRTAVWPSTLLGCAWGAWYELELARRVARVCFAPPPAVDAAVLRGAARSRSCRPRRRRRTSHSSGVRSRRRRRSSASSRAASSTGSGTSSASTRAAARATSTPVSGRRSTPS